MKKIIYIQIIFILGANFLWAQPLNDFLDQTDDFLKEVVVKDRVNYRFITKNNTSLSELVQSISTMPIDQLQEQERKAFLINAYNLLVIKIVSDNYPITSPQKISGFFEKIKHNIGSHTWTLSELENNHIRKNYQDPRIHFVLNCGAVSCPPITNFTYRPSILDQQLEEQTRLALNDSNFIYQKNEKNYLSYIFKWYAFDFKSVGGALAFINQYRSPKLNSDQPVIYYPYDWLLNDSGPDGTDPNNTLSFVQSYTPSSLLKKNQLEVQLFNNLYTQTAYRDDDRNKIDLHQRQTYFTGLLNFLFGASSSANYNIGLDINLKSVRIDEESSSLFKVFSFQSDFNNRTAIGSLGPTFKFKPFKKSSITIKSSFLIPIAEDGEADERNAQGEPVRPWLDWNRFTWWNQIFYDRNLGSDFQLFLEADLLFRFAKPAERYANDFPKNNLLSTPISAFLSYFPSEKSTVYGMVQYAPTFVFDEIDDQGNKSFRFFPNSDYVQIGVGGKYQVAPRIGLEVLYTNFIASANAGAGSTFNLGIRYIY